MAVGMSDGKVDRISESFKQRLGGGWHFVPDFECRYSYGTAIAERGDVRAVLEVNHVPLLRISAGDGGEEIVSLPVLGAETVGALAASIAKAVARAREAGGRNA